MDPSTLPDPTAVQSWPQAVVYVVLILCVIALPTWITYLGNRRIKKVQTTLTTNNGGSSVKDALDRIERKVDGVEQKVDGIEQRVATLEDVKVSGLLGFLRR